MDKNESTIIFSSHRSALEGIGHADFACVQLGGVKLYSADQTQLLTNIRSVGQSLAGIIASQPSIQKRELFAELRNIKEQHHIDDRAAGAILGSLLRAGEVDSLACAASTGRLFRVIVSASESSNFEHRVQAISKLLKERGELSSTVIRHRFFPSTGKESWKHVSHLMGRTVFIGSAHYITPHSIRTDSVLMK